MYVLKPKKRHSAMPGFECPYCDKQMGNHFFTGIRNKGTGSLPWHHPGSKLGFSILLGYDLCSWPFT